MFAAPATLAGAKPSATVVKSAYRHVLSSDFDSYTVRYVDLDGNGIKELLVNGGTSFGGMAVYSYKSGAGRVVRLAKMMPGKAYAAPLRYSKGKHRFCLTHADTGGGETRIYRVKGAKATRVMRFVYKNGKFTSGHKAVFKVNGKKVGESTYNAKLKRALKGYKKLAAPRY